MKKRIIIGILMTVALVVGFFNVQPSHAYKVLLKTVFAEHVAYDQNFFKLQEATYVLAGMVMTGVNNPEEKVATVDWSPDKLRILDYRPLNNSVTAYTEFLGYIPPTSSSDWENITFNFSFEGVDLGSITTDYEIKSLPLPFATYIPETKTVIWQDVEGASIYKVRILDNTLGYLDLDRHLFDSGNLSETSYEFPASAYPLLEGGSIICVEAWDAQTEPKLTLFNTSVYVTAVQTDLCRGDLNGNGVVDGSDLSIFATEYGDPECNTH